MPDINAIGINQVGSSRRDGIPEVQIWRTLPSASIPQEPPVVLQLGVPVVDIPGCVETHPDGRKNQALTTDDQRGVVVHCDAGMPSFDAIDYTPENLIFTSPAQVPKLGGGDKDTDSETGEGPPVIPPGAVLPCPLPDALPVGSMNASRTKRITAYKLENGKCVTRYEGMPVMEVINEQLPDIPVVITTATIAAVATTSALLAKPLGDILLKIIKPTVKKVIKKIAAIRGKTKILNPVQRRAEQRSLKK